MKHAFEIPFELSESQDTCSSLSRRRFLLIAASVVAAAVCADESSLVLTPYAGEAALVFIDWPLS